MERFYTKLQYKTTFIRMKISLSLNQISIAQTSNLEIDGHFFCMMLNCEDT